MHGPGKKGFCKARRSQSCTRVDQGAWTVRQVTRFDSRPLLWTDCVWCKLVFEVVVSTRVACASSAVILSLSWLVVEPVKPG